MKKRRAGSLLGCAPRPPKEDFMSKYEPLWQYLQGRKEDALTLTFAEIGAIAGVPLDHSFLRFKKELLAYGWQVGKISMKAETVAFARLG